MLLVKASENRKARHMEVASFWVNPALIREVWPAHEFSRENPSPGTEWLPGQVGPGGWTMDHRFSPAVSLQTPAYEMRWSRVSPTDSVITWIHGQEKTRVGWTAEVLGQLLSEWQQRMGVAWSANCAPDGDRD